MSDELSRLKVWWAGLYPVKVLEEALTDLLDLHDVHDDEAGADTCAICRAERALRVEKL